MERLFIKSVLLFIVLSLVSCSSTPAKTSSLHLPSDIQIEAAICRDTAVRDNLIEPKKSRQVLYTRHAGSNVG
ncbi:MAG: hypothetical protein HY754_04550 [Nitrospirae bacterium]|nr:hypothetical protein [Nitrospirota bacterium]